MKKPLVNSSDASRGAGLSRLSRVKSRMGKQYRTNRNYDTGAGQHKYVTTLSPWVSLRLLYEQEIINAALSAHKFCDAEKFIQEVFWRTYWKGWLEMRPMVWREFTRQRDAALADFRDDTEYLMAISGNTNIECFNEWVIDLKETGYLHNHARMWFASIWIFTLRLPWVLGADFFLQNLLDGDAASNTLSWRWVAGIQTPGKIYLARAENINKFTDGRHKPVGKLVSKGFAIDDSASFNAEPLHLMNKSLRGRRTLLIVTDNDLGINTSYKTFGEIVGVVGLDTVQFRSPKGVSQNVSNFVTSAVLNTIEEFSKKKSIPARFLSPNNWTLITDFARQFGAETCVALRTPIGPTRDVLGNINTFLKLSRTEFVEHTRIWDQVSWPHATKGYFKFKGVIPKVLSSLEQNL